jgi:proline racemase
MRTVRMIEVVGCHAEGEIGNVTRFASPSRFPTINGAP